MNFNVFALWIALGGLGASWAVLGAVDGPRGGGPTLVGVLGSVFGPVLGPKREPKRTPRRPKIDQKIILKTIVF